MPFCETNAVAAGYRFCCGGWSRRKRFPVESRARYWAKTRQKMCLYLIEVGGTAKKEGRRNGRRQKVIRSRLAGLGGGRKGNVSNHHLFVRRSGPRRRGLDLYVEVWRAVRFGVNRLANDPDKCICVL